jgi:esterase
MKLAVRHISGARPERALIFLHGILGRGINLQTIAKRFVEERPDWSAQLVDLRGHGDSPKVAASPSIENAARDVLETATGVGLPVHAVFGHSFGGKVALEVLRLNAIEALEHVFVVDSPPGAREPVRGGDSALGILEIIASLPPDFPSLTDFTAALQAKGISREVSQWLSGSTEREGNRVRFALDLQEMNALIMDYFRTDLWKVVENPPDETRVHLVIGDRSDSYSPSDRQRAAQFAAVNPNVTVDVLPAGHWVHVDDPDGLMSVLTTRTQ